MEDSLLGINDICRKLVISRSSFERLRRGIISAYIKGKQSIFPRPTVTIGRRPLWSTQSLNDWINS